MLWKNSNSSAYAHLITARMPLGNQFYKQGSTIMKARITPPRGTAGGIPYHSAPSTASYIVPSPCPLNTGAFPKLLRQEVDQSPSHKAVHVQTSNPKPMGNGEKKLSLQNDSDSVQLNTASVQADGLSITPSQASPWTDIKS